MRMTEVEWLTCTDPQLMLEFLRSKASDRKLRLFACACCRRQWHELDDPRSRAAVESAERFADGELSKSRCKADRTAALAISKREDFGYDAHTYAAAACGSFPVRADLIADLVAGWPGDEASEQKEKVNQAAILRDFFGPLSFRLVVLAPAWLRWNHGTVPAIARRIYDGRAFHDLPILADALEDAGCTGADILTHCRQPGEHVRGCWVVDLILGKS
jgi:hypothetical protein